MREFDIQYKDMTVRIFYHDLEYSFKVIEGEDRLGIDDKINIIKYLGGYK